MLPVVAYFRCFVVSYGAFFRYKRKKCCPPPQFFFEGTLFCGSCFFIKTKIIFDLLRSQPACFTYIRATPILPLLCRLATSVEVLMPLPVERLSAKPSVIVPISPQPRGWPVQIRSLRLCQHSRIPQEEHQHQHQHQHYSYWVKYPKGHPWIHNALLLLLHLVLPLMLIVMVLPMKAALLVAAMALRAILLPFQRLPAISGFMG